ncbi:MAG: delta(1)-pyrroline-2-carboxylate reductase family protein, partial [Comamonas sp.]
MTYTLDPERTDACLPWAALVDEIESLLQSPTVQVPERIVMPTAHGAVLFVMPATDGQVAMTKLITLTPANAAGALPAIQGDVTVFDVATGV